MNYRLTCIGSLYKNTSPLELIVSVASLYKNLCTQFHIILIVDGPITSELQLCLDALFSLYPISIIKHDVNLGLAEALNKAILCSSTEYILRFDTDDVSLPSRIDYQLKHLDSNPEIAVLGSQVIEYTTNTIGHYLFRSKKVPVTSSNVHSSLKMRNPLNHPSVILRKSLVMSVNLYPINSPYFEDFHLWTKLVKAGAILENLSLPLLIMHRPSASSRRSGFKYFLYEIKFIYSLFRESVYRPSALLLLLARAIIRLLVPDQFHEYVPWRTRWHPNIDLSNYLAELFSFAKTLQVNK